MCIFIRPVTAVKETKILVAPTADGRQLTAYANYVTFTGGRQEEKKSAEAEERKKVQNAMILPFPLPVEGDKKDQDIILLVNLESCDKVLDDCDKAFPKVVAPVSRSRGCVSRGMKSLAVFEVGSYSCSVAPSLQDLNRIDRKIFKVAPHVDKMLSGTYGKGFGFLICKLKASGKQHPICYVHSLPAKDELFVPTRHEHGNTDGKAQWDHKIYSCNTTDGKEAGPSTVEVLKVCQDTLERKGEKSGYKIDYGPDEKTILRQIPFVLSKPETFRRLIKVGSHDNKDFLFKFEPTTAKLNNFVQSSLIIKPPQAK